MNEQHYARINRLLDMTASHPPDPARPAPATSPDTAQAAWQYLMTHVYRDGYRLHLLDHRLESDGRGVWIHVGAHCAGNLLGSDSELDATLTELSRQIGAPRPEELTPADLTPNSRDGSHRGLTDLYDEARAVLEGLLAGSGDFITSWWSSKHELVQGRVSRAGGAVYAEACREMDEGEDLIHDAYSDLRHAGLIPADIQAVIDETSGERVSALMAELTGQEPGRPFSAALAAGAARATGLIHDPETFGADLLHGEIPVFSSATEQRLAASSSSEDVMQALNEADDAADQVLKDHYETLKRRLLALLNPAHPDASPLLPSRRV